MKRFALLFVSWVVVAPCFAANDGTGLIINVSRKLRLSKLEPIPPKDYFIDLGTRDGLKEGDILEVTRPLAAVNILWGGPSRAIRVFLGELQVVSVGEAASVARASAFRDPRELPVLQYAEFFLGDEVRLKSR